MFDEMFERISTTIQGRLKFGQVLLLFAIIKGLMHFDYMYINCCDPILVRYYCFRLTFGHVLIVVFHS